MQLAGVVHQQLINPRSLRCSCPKLVLPPFAMMLAASASYSYITMHVDRPRRRPSATQAAAVEVFFSLFFFLRKMPSSSASRSSEAVKRTVPLRLALTFHRPQTAISARTRTKLTVTADQSDPSAWLAISGRATAINLVVGRGRGPGACRPAA